MNIIKHSHTNDYLYAYYLMYTYKWIFVWIEFHVTYKWLFVWILFHVDKQMIIFMNIISCSQPNEYFYEYYYMLTYK